MTNADKQREELQEQLAWMTRQALATVTIRHQREITNVVAFNAEVLDEMSRVARACDRGRDLPAADQQPDH
jgi:hypothetical protein